MEANSSGRSPVITGRGKKFNFYFDYDTVHIAAQCILAVRNEAGFSEIQFPQILISYKVLPRAYLVPHTQRFVMLSKGPFNPEKPTGPLACGTKEQFEAYVMAFKDTQMRYENSGW
jgi:hypothetical protein